MLLFVIYSFCVYLVYSFLTAMDSHPVIHFAVAAPGLPQYRGTAGSSTFVCGFLSRISKAGLTGSDIPGVDPGKGS
ncbi:uncharacterized protein BDZ83DRAFT_616823 [Colletotrichum acutatum]|uniref:Uncharacterized protein n=1 Tax=Glomerella acutata TaxID=27357 RepID=A0AAD8UQW5_GLOAC|nr:uncharacterized protein BDZ83DRAFT_616823 [Colletotrichum acutatum]KAK1726229.1 hypothetical protein BDZ83DRAFT_616823 [Colletotrichum acutatum]